MKDVDERQAEKGKTEHSTGENSKVWMLRQEINDGQQSIDKMEECAVCVLTIRRYTSFCPHDQQNSLTKLIPRLSRLVGTLVERLQVE